MKQRQQQQTAATRASGRTATDISKHASSVRQHTAYLCSLICLLLTCSPLHFLLHQLPLLLLSVALPSPQPPLTHSLTRHLQQPHSHTTRLARILCIMPRHKKPRIAWDASGSAVAASASVAAAAVHPPPPHTRLYADVLGATFDFLTFKELRSAMMVCRGWLAAIYAMRGLTSGTTVSYCSNLAPLLASRLSRHVSRFGDGSQLMAARRLQQLVVAMPFLRTLAFRLATDPGWQPTLHTLHLPSTLRTVHLFDLSNLSVESINALIAVRSRQAALTVLELIFNQTLASAVSFTPLQAATSLVKLRISCPSKTELTPQHLQQIRQLAVTELDLHPCSAATLLSLLQMEGPPLRWTKLPAMMRVDDAVASLLPTLPHLVELSSLPFSRESLTSFAFLSQMPALRSLTINLCTKGHVIAARYDAYLVAMNQPLPHLTSFTLTRSQLSTAQLTSLLSLMPRLESLRLEIMHELKSLTCLLPVKDTLRSLKLVWCAHGDMLPIKLQPLLQLQQLTELRLDRSLSQPFDDLSLALFTPPTQLLPRLTKFSYTPR